MTEIRQYIAGNTEIPWIRKEISKVAGLLWEKGWAERNAGNLSYNVTGLIDEITDNIDFDPSLKMKHTYPHLDKNLILVSGTGTRMRDLAEDPHGNTCIIHITEGGSAYRLMQKSGLDKILLPTSELPSHLAIHNMLRAENRDDRVILHTHPDKLIALTHIREFCDEERINNMLWSIQPETCVFIHDGLGFVPYLRTGTDELAGATIEKLRNHRIALWEKHGCLAVGKNTHEAFDLIDIAEKSAGIFFTCKNAGYEVEGISKKNLDELREAFDIEKKDRSRFAE